jgi:hypothetical protein
MLVVVLLVLWASEASALCAPQDRAALVDLYGSTAGSQWANGTGWNTTSDCCLWTGLTCDAAGTRVSQL